MGGQGHEKTEDLWIRWEAWASTWERCWVSEREGEGERGRSLRSKPPPSSASRGRRVSGCHDGWWWIRDSIFLSIHSIHPLPTSCNQRDGQQCSIHALARLLVDAWIIDREDYPRSRGHICKVVHGVSTIILICVFHVDRRMGVGGVIYCAWGFMREAIDQCRCSVGRGGGRTGGCCGKSSECVPGTSILCVEVAVAGEHHHVIMHLRPAAAAKWAAAQQAVTVWLSCALIINGRMGELLLLPYLWQLFGLRSHEPAHVWINPELANYTSLTYWRAPHAQRERERES